MLTTTQETAAKTRVRAAPPGAARSVRLWQLGAGAAGCLLGAGQVFGGAAPFGLALVLGCAPGLALPAAAGALAAAFAFQPMGLAIRLAGALAAALAGRMAAARRPRWAYIAPAGAACAALFAEQLAVVLAGRTTWAETALVAATAGGAAALGAALRRLPAGGAGHMAHKCEKIRENCGVFQNKVKNILQSEKRMV